MVRCVPLGWGENVPTALSAFLLIEGLTFKRSSASLGTHKAGYALWRKFFSTKC